MIYKMVFVIQDMVCGKMVYRMVDGRWWWRGLASEEGSVHLLLTPVLLLAWKWLTDKHLPLSCFIEPDLIVWRLQSSLPLSEITLHFSDWSVLPFITKIPRFEDEVDCSGSMIIAILNHRNIPWYFYFWKYFLPTLTFLREK